MKTNRRYARDKSGKFASSGGGTSMSRGASARGAVGVSGAGRFVKVAGRANELFVGPNTRGTPVKQKPKKRKKRSKNKATPTASSMAAANRAVMGRG